MNGNNMKITVIGTGYVGLVTGTCLAYAGHTVTCVDNDAVKVVNMQAGKIPIYEPGLDELFQQTLASGHLKITTDLTAGIDRAEVIFLALPTPPGADGSADLSAVLSVATQLGPLLKAYTVIVNKSTVPVGTGERVAACIQQAADVAFDVVSNPEFLREGLAVQDFLHPDRIVIGTGSERARDIMRLTYMSFVHDPAQIVWMDIRSAEMTKYAANSFLAMKVSFMNEIANLCEKVGANVDEVRLGIGPDPRIGHRFLNAGIGYGGSCFPKDVQALQHTAKENGYDFKLLTSIIDVNASQKQKLVEKVLDYYEGDIEGRHFALWGLAFKPDTDDIRDAPSLDIITSLVQHGATISVYDPQATANVRRYLTDVAGVHYPADAMTAAQDADALLIATEWDEFRNPDFDELKTKLREPVIFDGRNIYDIAVVTKHGYHYSSVGRPAVSNIVPVNQAVVQPR